MISDFRRLKQLNTLRILGETLVNNLLALLFIMGLSLINVASYIGFGLVTGLFVTGVTLIVITIILALEQPNQPPKQN